MNQFDSIACYEEFVKAKEKFKNPNDIANSKPQSSNSLQKCFPVLYDREQIDTHKETKTEAHLCHMDHYMPLVEACGDDDLKTDFWKVFKKLLTDITTILKDNTIVKKIVTGLIITSTKDSREFCQKIIEAFGVIGIDVRIWEGEDANDLDAATRDAPVVLPVLTANFMHDLSCGKKMLAAQQQQKAFLPVLRDLAGLYSAML